MGKLLQSGEFSDFEFTIGQRKFPVHKNILYSCSPYFKAMFTLDFEEKAVNSVPIEDVDADLFAEMLEYLYTSRPPKFIDESKTIEMLILADRYQIDSLKTICENELFGKITIDSMFSLLMVADTYNASNLRRNTIYFISDHATSKNILDALFDNKIFGSVQSETTINVMRDLSKVMQMQRRF